jgi:hypothetical protein
VNTVMIVRFSWMSLLHWLMFPLLLMPVLTKGYHLQSRGYEKSIKNMWLVYAICFLALRMTADTLPHQSERCSRPNCKVWLHTLRYCEVEGGVQSTALGHQRDQLATSISSCQRKAIVTN